MSATSFERLSTESLVWQHLVHEVLGVLGQLLGELDVEGDENVAAFVGLLGQRQSVAGDPLDRGRLHNLVGEVDRDLLPGEGGDVHQDAAQCLSEGDFTDVSEV